MNVLIVEDEKGLAEEIRSFLSKENFICEMAHSGKEASEKIFVNNYDFVLLDLGLPDYEGLDLLKEAKEANRDSAFIILTARGAVDDKVKGLNLGADDYIAKPFSLLELLSRINAITRRRHGLKKNIITIKGFTIDLQKRTVHFDSKEIILTKKEFDILSYLVLHKSRVLTRIQLTEHIWGDVLEENYDSNYVDVHMKNLRKKMSVHAPADWIETVRGIGYRINI
jgi:DNA-binding response OmpR family regulator